MKRFTTAISLAALSLLLAAPASAEEAVKVEGRVFHDPAAAQEAAPAKLHLDPASLPVRAARGASSQGGDVVLPPLSTQELARLQQPDGSHDKGLRIGVGRNVPDSFGQPDTWHWVAVEGGQVAYLGLTSSGAQRVRVKLQVGNLPDGVELQFYAPADPKTVYGPFTRTELAAQPKDASGNTLFWSPSVAGDTLRMEVFLPDGVQPADLKLGIPQLSHVAMDAASGQKQAGVLESNDAACYIGLACATPAWQRTGAAVGGYQFTKVDGSTYRCSGTVVNNTANDGIPYFLTANHCIDNPQDAASMEFFWRYAGSACGSNDAAQWMLWTAGGSKLLATDGGLDITLVQLLANPPSDTTYAGWSATPLNYQEAVAGIHHDGINGGISPKLFSAGYFLGHAEVQDGNPVAVSEGRMAVVQWTYGVTEHGSSGSGLWAVKDGVHYLKGVLSQGDVSCSNPTGKDVYGRFDLAYPLLKPWLNPAH
ncbi:trypsin-like peptidase domain-containing protein [Candidatus Thiothrix sp. Deng01]|uniref:Trypsin-like peptidase domain-containing protein n=1 Tax=Candidatus Thiothrix phosphatis TaxID=3112415 RepID=A0ABU6CVB2_9GAMM|nr:trypsin-like peptidase domain-containing protein [Candidatus Thiothrix sp. Deng01]MEB4590769.1 trypsin-like peptidase domain-containing protein [Candidatus Thiothrix sp. Deng01]